LCLDAEPALGPPGTPRNRGEATATARVNDPQRTPGHEHPNLRLTIDTALRVTVPRPNPPGRKRSKGNRTLPGARWVFFCARAASILCSSEHAPARRAHAEDIRALCPARYSVSVAHCIYLTSAEGHSGKSTIALGVLDALVRTTPRVGVFRPIARSTEERDDSLEMLLGHTSHVLDYDDCIGATYEQVRADPDAALALIVQRFKAIEAQCDAVVIVGSDYTDVGSPTELSYNARIAANLGAPVLLVLGGRANR